MLSGRPHLKMLQHPYSVYQVNASCHRNMCQHVPWLFICVRRSIHWPGYIYISTGNTWDTLFFYFAYYIKILQENQLHLRWDLYTWRQARKLLIITENGYHCSDCHSAYMLSWYVTCYQVSCSNTYWNVQQVPSPMGISMTNDDKFMPQPLIYISGD